MLAGRKVSALSEESLGSVHILVAEDEAFLLEAVRKVLNNIGRDRIEPCGRAQAVGRRRLQPRSAYLRHRDAGDVGLRVRAYAALWHRAAPQGPACPDANGA